MLSREKCRYGVRLSVACAIACCAVAVTVSAEEQSPGEWAHSVMQATGVQGGLIVHVPCDDGAKTAALLINEKYVAQGLHEDAAQVAAFRDRIVSLDQYGEASVEVFDGRRLPYTEGLVNLLVSEDLGDLSMAEVMRVLAPGGVAHVRSSEGWRTIVKPWPEEMDEWTHWLHGPDGNAVANDQVVAPPRRARWIAEPTWQRHHETSPSIDAMVSAGGRIFAIVNEAPVGVDGLPDRWMLIARDAFNGTLLWKRPIDQWGWTEWSDHSYGHGRWNQPTHIARRLVAIDDRVYVTLGFNAPLTAIDAATGETLNTYDETEFTDEILYEEGTLLLAVNETAQEPGDAEALTPSKKFVLALDAVSGEKLWKAGPFEGAASKADAIQPITHITMVLGSGKAFLVEEHAVVALDMRTGQEIWRHERPTRQRAVTYGSYYFTNLCSLVFNDGVVFFTEPDDRLKKQPWNDAAQSTLMGLDADSGDLLWSRPAGVWGHYNEGDIFIIDGQVWTHAAEGYALEALDPRTGELLRTISTEEALNQGHHHRCYRNKATTQYVITGRRGVEFIDLETNENKRQHWVRGTCRYGVMPCNGLLYAPPHPCICYITAKLNGFWALAGEGEEASPSTPADLIEYGPAYDTILEGASIEADAEDWPTFRHDEARSGCAGTPVSETLKVAWERSLGGRLTSPVVADGRLIVALPDAYSIHALDATDGNPLWRFTAGGRIDTPPTAHHGLVLFGCANGWAYCLRAKDGALAWRRRAAPQDSRMMNRGRLESPWPVHGNVLVQNDIAYFTAGRSSFLDGGIFIYAVDPVTGELLQSTCLSSLDPETDDMIDSPASYDMPSDALGGLSDILVGDGSNVYMRHVKFNPNDLTHRSAAEDLLETQDRKLYPALGAHLMSVAGLLDDAWFNQTYWTIDGRAQSKLLVYDDETAFGVKPYPGAARHSRAIFRPGGEGYALNASRRPEHRMQWTTRVSIRPLAMLLAGETLFLAGPPDVIPTNDPYAAFNGDLGSQLWAVSTTDGIKTAKYSLESVPVFNGMAAAQGRLYISTEEGRLTCFEAASAE